MCALEGEAAAVHVHHPVIFGVSLEHRLAERKERLIGDQIVIEHDGAAYVANALSSAPATRRPGPKIAVDVVVLDGAVTVHRLERFTGSLHKLGIGRIPLARPVRHEARMFRRVAADHPPECSIVVVATNRLAVPPLLSAEPGRRWRAPCCHSVSLLKCCDHGQRTGAESQHKCCVAHVFYATFPAVVQSPSRISSIGHNQIRSLFK